MDFGRPREPDTTTSLVLPPLERLVAKALTPAPSGAPALRVGAPSWSHREWLGTVLPRGARSASWLGHYARWLPAVELDATFHRVPPPDTLRRWRSAVPAEFRFCPKLPRAVSHAGDLGLGGALERALDQLRELGDALGCLLLQLPERFGPDRLSVLERALERAQGDVAVELRHPGFFTAGRVHAAAQDLIAGRGARLVVCDVSGRRDVLHGVVAGAGAFVRLGSFLDSARDAARARAWGARLAQISGQNYLFVHQPDPRALPGVMAAAGLACAPRAGGTSPLGLDRAE